MIGPDGVAAAIADALTDRLPAATAGLRARLGMLPADLPDVTRVVAHEPDQVGIEQWPMAVVTTLGDRDWRPLGVDPTGARSWRVTYQVRVHVWARGDTYQTTNRTQRLLYQAVVEAILTDLTVGDVTIDDRTLTGSMSGIEATDAGRTVAGARLDLDCTVEETLPQAAPVLVTQITDADTRLLQPPPR